MPPAATWKEAVLYWVMRQGILAFLIFILIGMVGWVGKYSLETGVPAMIRQVNLQFENQERSHRAERAESEAKTTAQLAKVIDSMDQLTRTVEKMLDRIEKR